MRLYGHFDESQDEPRYLRGSAPPDQWRAILPLPQGRSQESGTFDPGSGRPIEEIREFEAHPDNVRHIIKHAELDEIKDNRSGGQAFNDWMRKASTRS